LNIHLKKGTWGKQNMVFRLILFNVILLLTHNLAFAKNQVHKIGVLAPRGESNALKRWSATAQYLSKIINGHTFTIVPLNLNAMDSAIQLGEIDFVLTNTGNYVKHEANHGINRITTVKTLRYGKPYTKFGAVIFTRSDRSDIYSLSDLKNKSFMAVKKHAFGGFQMAWREFKAVGIDPFNDFSELRFNGFPQDSIVYAVKDGTVDAGTIRTDLLEKMAAEGKINLRAFRILNRKKNNGFPFIHSTRLYPEWPLAKLKHTSEELSQQVVIALLSLPSKHASAIAANIDGWTIPLDYQPVHKMMQELKVSPYENFGEINLNQFLRQYWPLIVSSIFILLIFSVVMIAVLVLNRKLIKSNQSFTKEIKQRKNIENISSRLGRIIDTSSDNIFIFDAKLLKISHVNQTAFHSLGYTHAEMYNMTMLDIELDMSHHEFEEILNPLRTKEKKSITHTTKYYSKDGTFHFIEGHIQLFANEDPPVFASVAHRIDDHVNKEISLTLENNRISNILECTNDAYFALDKHWNFTYINTKAEQLFETRRELLLNKSIWDEIPELASAFFKKFNHSLLHNESMIVEGYYPPLNKWVDAHTYPSINGLTVYLRDKTNEKRLTEKLFTSDFSLNTVLNSVSEGIITIDSFADILSFNSTAENIFGYTADEVVGKNINTLIPGQLKPKHDEIIAKIRYLGEIFFNDMNRTVIGQKKDGSIINLKLLIKNVSTKENNKYIGIFSDISENKAEIIDIQTGKNEFNTPPT